MRRESEREQPDYDGLCQQWINGSEESAVVEANSLKQASLVFGCRPLFGWPAFNPFARYRNSIRPS